MSYQEWKPVFLILLVNLVLAIGNTLLKVVLSQGLNHMVIVAYRLSASGIFLAPIACFLERKKEAKLTPIVLGYIFISALLGGFMAQYLFLMGLQYTTVEFASAFLNMAPSTTFLLAALLRQEKLKLKSKSGTAKVFGSILCIAGVILLASYQGFPLIKSRDSVSGEGVSGNSTSVGPRRRVTGTIILTASMLAWSSWFLIQGRITKRYPCKYSSTAIWSLFGATQAAVACLAFNRDVSIWVLQGKIQVLTILFCGIVASGLCYVGMSWCVEQRGPVFTAAFTPFSQIFAALLEVVFLHEQIYLGSVLGSIVVISGLYALLWGKRKEAESLPSMSTVKEAELGNENGAVKSNISAEVDGVSP